MSYVKEQQQQRKAVKEKVLKITGTSSDDYHTYLYKVGMDWLQVNTAGDEMGVDALSSCRNFWVWWQNQWFLVDQRFLRLYAGRGFRRDQLKDRWERMHRPGCLKLQLNNNVQQEAYAILVQKCIDEINAKSKTNTI